MNIDEAVERLFAEFGVTGLVAKTERYLNLETAEITRYGSPYGFLALGSDRSQEYVGEHPSLGDVHLSAALDNGALMRLDDKKVPFLGIAPGLNYDDSRAILFISGQRPTTASIAVYNHRLIEHKLE